MEALALPNFTTPSAADTVEKTKENNRLKTIVTSPAIKLMLILTVSVAAWTSWKPSLYDQYKLHPKYVANQLAETAGADFTLAAKYTEAEDFGSARQIVAKAYHKNVANNLLATKYAALLIVGGYLADSKQVLYPVYKSPSKNDRAAAAYLLALTFLKEENYTIARYWLNRVPQNTVYYHQAEQLATRLKFL